MSVKQELIQLEQCLAGSTYADDEISLITNGTTRLFINSSGNIGIGTTSPVDTLEAAGDQYDVKDFMQNVVMIMLFFS